MEVHLRAYEAGDREGCLASFESNVPRFFTEDEVADFAEFLDSLPNRLPDSKTHFYVIMQDNEIVGGGGFSDRDDSGEISLAWGFIHSGFHKRGLGERLLKFRLEQIAQVFPGSAVYLDTTQHSKGFFEKNGFEVLKVTDDFYAPGMHRYDMVYGNPRRL